MSEPLVAARRRLIGRKSKGEDNEESSSSNNASFLWPLLLLLLVLGSIIAFSVTIPVLHNQHEDAIRQNAATTRMEIEALRGELVELAMDTTNTTVTSTGTFLWAMGSTADETVSPACNGFFTQYASVIAINAPGTGYAVDDLIILRPEGLLGVTGVLKVLTVGGGGDLVAVDVLTPGCCSGSGAVTLTLTDGGGSGATFTITCDTPAPFDSAAVYSYPAPPSKPLTAPRLGTYRMLSVRVGAAQFSILELSKPTEGAAGPFRATVGTAVSKMQIAAYNFEPVPSELHALATYGYTVPLTFANRAALSFSDSSNCLAAQTCFMSAYSDYQPTSRNAISFSATSHGSVLGPYFVSYPTLSLYYNEVEQAGTIDFAANNAEFTLLSPLHLVLPAL